MHQHECCSISFEAILYLMINDMFIQMSLEGRSLVTLKLLNGQWEVLLVSSKVVHWKSCFLVNCGAQSITLSTIEHNRSQLGTIEHNTLLLSSCWTETRSCQFVTPQFFFFQLLINWWSTNGFLDHSFRILGLEMIDRLQIVHIYLEVVLLSTFLQLEHISGALSRWTDLLKDLHSTPARIQAR